jgi:hypothetical protein
MLPLSGSINLAIDSQPGWAEKTAFLTCVNWGSVERLTHHAHILEMKGPSYYIDKKQKIIKKTLRRRPSGRQVRTLCPQGTQGPNAQLSLWLLGRGLCTCG